MKTLKILLLILLIGLNLKSNNIQISNVQLVNLNTTNHTVDIQFDISWENSWRKVFCDFTEAWDAAWVFVKYREGCYWFTPHLDKNNHQTVSGVTIAANDNVGVMIYRTDTGTGDFSATGIKLRWQYDLDGISDSKMLYSLTNSDSLEVAVLGIEMVYIPEGAFQVGGGDHSSGYIRSFYAYNEGNAYNITGTGSSIVVGQGNGNLWSGFYHSGSFPTTLNDSFPTGYEAFYIMKYELSQQQYVDFLNMLPYGMAMNREPHFKLQYGQVIRGPFANPPHWRTLAPNRPVLGVNVTDAAAYADWSGLRPMTELEYEKACRGTAPALWNEYAWGTSFICNKGYGRYTVVNPRADNEIVSDPDTVYGNAVWHYTNRDSVLRCGIFAATLPNGGSCGIARSYTGGSFYGVMELTGNVKEPVINVMREEGRAYRGGNGDGILNGSGEANQYAWPTNTNAWGYRGGSYVDYERYLYVCSRGIMRNQNNNKDRTFGIRLVRDMKNAVIIQ